MALPAPVGYLYWYTTSIILALLTLLNAVNHIYRYITRPSSTPSAPLTAMPSPTKTFSSAASLESGRSQRPQLSALDRAARAARVVAEKCVILTALPLPNLRFWIKQRTAKSSISTAELTWQVCYVLGVLVLSFAGTGWDRLIVSNQAAWVAAAQVPLIIALAGKNNLVSFLTGIPYEKLNFLHRAAGRVCLVGIWIHTILHWSITKGFTVANWHEHISQWGSTGVIGFTLLYATSLPWFRRRLYEFFLVTHICIVAITLGAFIMHWRKVDVWIYPGIGLWVAERLCRMLRLVLLNRLWAVVPSPTASNLPSAATLTLLTPSTLMVSFQTPSPHLRWSAGQHFYVVMPGMSRLPWEAHPFTATTIPARPGYGTESGELTFIVRVRDGFTKEMKLNVDKERKTRGLDVDGECKVEVKAAVEGPYGGTTDMSRYNGIVIISGGSGISFALSHLLQIIRDARERKSSVQTVRVIWMVKSRLHLNWIAPILLQHVHSIPSSLRITLHVHVTKHYFSRNGSMSLPVRAMLPTNPTADQGYDFAKFLSRAAEPKRRKSRLMSPMSWATWTGAYDEDGQTGPGTRRGTILTEEVAKLRPAKKLGFFGRSSSDEDKGDLEVDEEKMTQADQVGVPTFSWTEGYAGDTIPSAGDTPPAAVDVPPEILAEFGGRRPSPSPRTRRLPSQAPGFSPVREEEDPLDVGPMDISPFSTASGSRLSPFSTANGRDISPFSTTYGREVSPFSAGPSRSRAVSYDMLSPQDPVPPDQVDSVDYPSPSFPAHEGRDALDVPFPLTLPHRRSSPGAPFSHRRSSPGAPDEPNITPPPHARRISISIEEPDHPRRKSSALSHKSSSPGSRKILLQASQPRRPSPILNISIHSEDSSFVTAGTSRPTQSNESSLSGRSDFSVSPASNLSTSPAPASLLVPSAPSPIGSGALTPALAETGADNFAGDALQMRRQSIGLESIVKWHEGRANLESVVMEMMEEVGQGGWVSVNACGPKSLLDSARNTVSDLSSVKSVWQGGVGVSFHSETFGW